MHIRTRIRTCIRFRVRIHTAHTNHVRTHERTHTTHLLLTHVCMQRKCTHPVLPG